MKGYIHRIGAVATTISAYLSRSRKPLLGFHGALDVAHVGRADLAGE